MIRAILRAKASLAFVRDVSQDGSRHLAEKQEMRTNLDTTEPRPLWQASDAAQILGISVKTVHKLVRERKLESVQVTARERRFTREQVQEYIRSQSTEVRVDK